MIKYVLMLNDMRSSQIENLQMVTAFMDDRQTLVDMYDGELCEPYQDGKWAKTFKKDGPLEWFNKAGSMTEDNDYFGGIYTVQPGWRVG